MTRLSILKNFPGKHLVHLAEPESTVNLQAGQSKHEAIEVGPKSAYLPALHATHEPPPVTLEKPALQVQAVLPAAESEFAGQLSQLAFPLAALYVPACALVHRASHMSLQAPTVFPLLSKNFPDTPRMSKRFL